ncbi:MAG: UDP-N-acetylmuramoyl-tripeptide--D-alanyl-D-alanine ligase [Granulosicoccus sp.]|jgi:UDP-N-acetylmuramoyl-tripeptide--D-alanyl-D-alanine ligase
MSIKELHKLFTDSTGVSTDSRKIWEGCIYIALKGDRYNGNEYAHQAIDQGAKYAIVDEPISNANSKIIRVESGLVTLQILSNYHRKSCGWPVLAITGSNGKTTSKELIGAVLRSKLNTLITEGNLNNHIGVPLTLLRGSKEHKVAVIEMGASHFGDIDELCEIADPDIGLITNIGKAHLEGMGGIEGVIKTKTELFDYIKSKNGQILLNTNQPLLATYYSETNACNYGSKHLNDLQGTARNENGYLIVDWKLQTDNKSHTIKTNLVGNYNLDNVLSAIAVGIHFGIAPDNIGRAIEEYMPTNNRSEYVESGNNRIIWDAYNANPSSMSAAIDNIANMNSERVVLILGEMNEVGKTSLNEHKTLVELAQSKNPTAIYLVGNAFGSISGVMQFENVENLETRLKSEPINDALILVKGSRSNQLEKLRGIL